MATYTVPTKPWAEQSEGVKQGSFQKHGFYKPFSSTSEQSQPGLPTQLLSGVQAKSLML